MTAVSGSTRSKAWKNPRCGNEVLNKYETHDTLVIDLPLKAEAVNAVEELLMEVEADELEDESSEAETEVDDEGALDLSASSFHQPMH